jgi:hypothetical protein
VLRLVIGPTICRRKKNPILGKTGKNLGRHSSLLGGGWEKGKDAGKEQRC